MDPDLSESVIVRRAEIKDARGIAEAHVLSWKATYPGLVPKEYLESLAVDDFTARWQLQLAPTSQMIVFVAEKDGVIQGFASGGQARELLPGFSAELYAIYLLSSSQSTGVGTRLFWAVAQGATEKGLNSMFVWVLKENSAWNFYARLGGQFLSESERLVGGQKIPQIAYGWSNLDKALLARPSHRQRHDKQSR